MLSCEEIGAALVEGQERQVLEDNSPCTLGYGARDEANSLIVLGRGDAGADLYSTISTALRSFASFTSM